MPCVLTVFILFVHCQDHGSQEAGCAFDGSVDDTEPVAPEKGMYAEYHLCIADIPLSEAQQGIRIKEVCLIRLWP